ncbi:MAG: VWA domain-containing protein, partial [Planctomycetota bacterium]
MTLDKPYWLLTLIILPVIVGLSRHSLSALGTFRRNWVIALRCLIVLVLSIALAEPQFHHPRQHACVMVLADESASMPEFLRSQSLEIASRAIHERQNPSDMVGVVVFGSDARIEVPPASHGPAKEIHAVRASVDRQGSDIGRAIRMALATIPADANARLVLCSDGNQNRGNALAEAANARQLGIPIDVVPLDFERSAEVIVEKLLLPERVKLGEQLRIKVVLRSMSDARGLLTIRRLTADGMSPVVEERVSLRQGINAFTVETRMDDPESYRFEAEFTPSSSADDHFAQNNRAGSYTIIEGTPRVLLIESEAGAESRLVESLSAAKIASVSVVPEELKESLNYYRPFDAVILANVPASRMTEAVQRAIVNNTRTLGTGLLVIGGPRSFGPGGYADSPLEEAFPVECDVESTRIEPSLAMLFVIDRSGSMSGPKIQLALAAAKHSVEMLEPRVEAGVIAFDGEPAWVRRLLPVGDRSALLQRLDSIQVGGGTEMFSALKLALESLLSSKQMIRHVILLSDGQSIPGDWNSLVTKF